MLYGGLTLYCNIGRRMSIQKMQFRCTTVNRNRMVRLAGPRDKYVIVLSLLTSRDEIRGRLLWKVFSRYIVDVVCASIFRHCLT